MFTLLSVIQGKTDPTAIKLEARTSRANPVCVGSVTNKNYTVVYYANNPYLQVLAYNFCSLVPMLPSSKEAIEQALRLFIPIWFRSTATLSDEVSPVASVRNAINDNSIYIMSPVGVFSVTGVSDSSTLVKYLGKHVALVRNQAEWDSYVKRDSDALAVARSIISKESKVHGSLPRKRHVLFTSFKNSPHTPKTSTNVSPW